MFSNYWYILKEFNFCSIYVIFLKIVYKLYYRFNYIKYFYFVDY